MPALATRRAFAAAAAAAAVAGPRIVRAQTLIPIAEGTTLTDDSSAMLYAAHDGLFRKAGLDVAISAMSSGAAISAAVAGGSLQIGQSSLIGLITAHAKGLPFQLIAPGHIYQTEAPTELLLVRKDSPIQTARDLNGKTVAAVAINDLNSTSIQAWMDANGGDSKTVKQVELPLTTQIAALEAGRVDAAQLGEPTLTNAMRTGNFRVLGKSYDAIGLRFLVAAYFATAAWASANRDAVQRFARVMRVANAYANAHHDVTAPILADFVKVDVSTVQRSTRVVFADTVLPSDLQPMISIAVKAKMIDRAFDARELISPAVLNLT